MSKKYTLKDYNNTNWLTKFITVKPCPNDCKLDDYLCSHCDNANSLVCDKCSVKNDTDRDYFINNELMDEMYSKIQEPKRKHIKIVYIKFIEHYVPNMSCGTGYSEPDLFDIVYEYKGRLKCKEIWIDVWYSPNIEGSVYKRLTRFEDDNNYIIDNKEEFYDMYKKALSDE